MPKCTQCLDGDIVLFPIHGDGGHCNRCDAFFSDAAITEIQNKTVPILAVVAANASIDGSLAAAAKHLADARDAARAVNDHIPANHYEYLRASVDAERSTAPA